MPTVLLIDDNKLLSLVEARYIQRAIANVDIVVSSNSLCTEDLARDKKPDITIMDTGLVDIAPLDLYRSLCKIVPPRSIIITGNESLQSFERLKEAHQIFDILIRPFGTDTIIHAVERALTEQGHKVIQYKSTYPPPRTVEPKFDRHLALNQLSGLLGAIRAFEAEIEAEGSPPTYVQDLLNEYIPRFVGLVHDVSKNIKLSKRKENIL